MKGMRDRILELVAQAESAVPADLVSDLPPGKHTSAAPEWHGFEHKIWGHGESIRKLLAEQKSLRRDEELQRTFLRVACNPNAKRGRQSFIMLLGYSCCAGHAPRIAEQLSDPSVVGHVIDTLLKMRCPDYVQDISAFTKSDPAWVRNKAKAYIKKYGNG